MKSLKEKLLGCKNEDERIEIVRDLQGANLQGANLQGADLQDADLQGADLQDADLQGADLQDADLQGADLQDADLRGANLQGANLRSVDLRSVNLRNANLQGADLRNANLQGADLRNVYVRICGKWSIQLHSPENFSIGCQRKSVKGWNEFFEGNEQMETPRNSLDFKEIQLNFEYAKIFVKRWAGCFKEKGEE